MRPGGLVGCIECGGSYHPFSHVKANPPLWSSSSIVWPPLVMCHWRDHGSPLRPYCLRVWPPQNCIGPVNLRYDTWPYYLIKFLYPTVLIMYLLKFSMFFFFSFFSFLRKDLGFTGFWCHNFLFWKAREWFPRKFIQSCLEFKKIWFLFIYSGAYFHFL